MGKNEQELGLGGDGSALNVVTLKVVDSRIAELGLMLRERKSGTAWTALRLVYRGNTWT
jgi:hypothetical protein